MARVAMINNCRTIEVVREKIIYCHNNPVGQNWFLIRVNGVVEL